MHRLLHDYLIENNPEIVLKSSMEFSVPRYIDDKVELVLPMIERWMLEGAWIEEAEEMALVEMSSDLRPSRFAYIKGVLAEEFPQEYGQLAELGVLTSEVVKLSMACGEVIASFGLAEGQPADPRLRHAVIAKLHEHLPRG